MKIYSPSSFAVGLLLLGSAALNAVTAALQWGHSALFAGTALVATLACAGAGLYRVRVALSQARTHQDRIAAHDERRRLVLLTTSLWTLSLGALLVALVALILAFSPSLSAADRGAVYALGGVLGGGVTLWVGLWAYWDHRL